MAGFRIMGLLAWAAFPLLLGPSAAFAQPLGNRVVFILDSCDDGSPHIFDCLAGSDVCGGMITTSQRCGGIPVLVNFAIADGRLRVRFTRDRNHLMNASGVAAMDIPLSDSDQVDRKVTLYEPLPDDPNPYRQSDVFPPTPRRSDTIFDAVRIMATPKDFNG